MNPFSSIWRSYLRWRHSKGFGVHSPFAYDFVINVVSPGPYAYYGYHDIDRLIRLPGYERYARCRNNFRLILRMIVNLKSRRLLLYPEINPIYHSVAHSASVKADIFDPENVGGYDSTDLLVISGEFPSAETISRTLDRGTAIVGIDPGFHLRSALETPRPRGLLMTGNHIVIAIPRKEMAFTSYTMKFQR